MTHPTKLVFLINENARVVKAVYEEGTGVRSYPFKTFDPSIEVDDVCVITTDTRIGHTCVKIVEIDVEPDLEENSEIKWIVDRVDIARHEQTVEEEKQMMQVAQSAQRRRKTQELREQLFKDQEAAFNGLAIANHGQEPDPAPAASEASDGED